jgi:hypothetical protein
MIRTAFFARWNGRSSNPGGRHRQLSSEALSAILEAPLPPGIRTILKQKLRIDFKRGARFGDALVTAIMAKALTGDVPAAREIRYSVEGREGERDQ